MGFAEPFAKEEAFETEFAGAEAERRRDYGAGAQGSAVVDLLVDIEGIDGAVALLATLVGTFAGAIVFPLGAGVICDEPPTTNGRGADDIIPVGGGAGARGSGERDVIKIPVGAASLVGNGAIGVGEGLQADDFGMELGAYGEG